MPLMGAPTAAKGTAPAIDQGIRGGITTAVSSSPIASFFLSGSISPQSWLVSIIVNV